MAEEQKKEKAVRMSYKNRKTNILKKGEELSTLCGVKVCVIVVSPNGKLETWPENLNDVKAVLSSVKGSGKPIRSEHRHKKGGGLCSRIKIPKPAVVADVKGKEICTGNNAAAPAPVVEEGRPETSCGAHKENNGEDDNVFMIDNVESLNHGATPLFDLSHKDHGVNQDPCYHYQWGGNKNTTFQNFGRCIQEPNLVSQEREIATPDAPALRPDRIIGQGTCSNSVVGGIQSQVLFPKYHPISRPDRILGQEAPYCSHTVACGIQPQPLFSKHDQLGFPCEFQGPNLDDAYGCGGYQQNEGGSSSAVNPEINFSNYMVPNEECSLPYHQQYEIGSTGSAMNPQINSSSNYVMQNQQPNNLAYQQYEIGSSSAMNSGVPLTNQHPHPCNAYGHQYQWSTYPF